MPVVADQIGRQTNVPASPQRIVSLVPSQTELLHYLGLGERVVGITRFCVHPREWYNSKSRVGGTKDASLDRIKALHPDLIIANKEENTQELVDSLAEHFPVWVSQVRDIESAKLMITDIAALTQTEERGQALTKGIDQTIASLPKVNDTLNALYLIWNDPIMVAGQDTYIDAMMARTGFCNIAKSERYPALTLDEIRDLEPEVMLYSSEPFPFKERHIKRFRELLPNASHLLVDGEAFSWYGSRLPQGLKTASEYFNTLRTPTE